MPVFFENKNNDNFLQQYTKYVQPFVKTFAYCLLNNHFHLLVQIEPEKELTVVIQKDKPVYWHVSNAFSSFLQSYTRAINKMYDRTGPLFESPFKRIAVTNDAYFSQLITYIHHNPMKHGFVTDFRDYPYSSYHAFLSSKNTKLERTEVMNWFGGEKYFCEFHENETIEPINKNWLLE